MPKATVRCPECGAPVKPKNLERHFEKTHSSEAIEQRAKRELDEKSRLEQLNSELVVCEKCGLEMTRANIKRHLEIAHGIGGPFLLISRRGTRVDTPQKCNACGKTKIPVWRYSQSTRGGVFICSSCKPRIFDRSFGRKDALDFAIMGGGFETKRSKH